MQGDTCSQFLVYSVTQVSTVCTLYHDDGGTLSAKRRLEEHTYVEVAFIQNCRHSICGNPSII